MAHTHTNQERTLKEPGLTFWMVFALGFAVVLTIALVGSLTGMPWRSWLPGAESCKSLFGGVQAAVYSFMSHTL
jgi:light-harvesting complex 1 beta chain